MAMQLEEELPLDVNHGVNVQPTLPIVVEKNATGTCGSGQAFCSCLLLPCARRIPRITGSRT